MIKIVGYKRTTGTFNSDKTGELIPYDNINLYIVQSVNSDSNLHGHKTDILKIKYSVAEAVLGLPESDWDSLIGQFVICNFTVGRFPRLESVEVVKK